MLAHQTVNYAVPPQNHFWQWSAVDEAIEWADGRTICLWQEVHTILAYVGKKNGLPPFGSILLLLSACREEWPQLRALNHDIVRTLMQIPTNDAIPSEIAEVLITGLDRIHALPQDLRTSLAAKCHLIAVLFPGDSHCLSLNNAAKILRDFSNFDMRITDKGQPALNAKSRFRKDLRALKHAFARHVDRLESLLRTGLENTDLSIPEIPQVFDEPDDTRDLLDYLETLSGELGAAAAIAKRTIAMIHFPGRFGAPQDLQVGGIADITNRGTIDRLLPGELAWDDLVLAARLVHNEALYFRREIPPADVAVSHTILLDRNLRLWGAARVFSLGVALGLRHHPALKDSQETFEVVAATREAFEYIDLTSLENVRHALTSLIPSPDSFIFLSTWWDAVQIVKDPAIPDITFITACEHLEHELTRQLLGEIATWIHARNGRFRIITLSRNGEMEMLSWSPTGNNVICRGSLDLADFLPKKSMPASPPSIPFPPNTLQKILPIYAEKRFPFLFPCIPVSSTFEKITKGSEDGIGVTMDRRLMYWPKSGWGAQELFCKLPGRQHWIRNDENGNTLVISTAEEPGQPVRVFRWKIDRLEEVKIEPSRHSFPRYAEISEGNVLLAYSDKIEALSLENGKRIAEQPIQSLPNSPELRLKGNQFTIKNSNKSNILSSEQWNRDENWPNLFCPDQISWEKGTLRVLYSDHCLEFDPLKLIWFKAEEGKAQFNAFENTNFSPTRSVTLKLAHCMHNKEVYYDSRGVLHLRSNNNSDETWSILLTTPISSIWSKSSQLCAHNDRMRMPYAKSPALAVLQQLQKFLAESL